MIYSYTSVKSLHFISKVAKGVKGFKSKGKYFKIMGPKGEDRQTFQNPEVRKYRHHDMHSIKRGQHRQLLGDKNNFLF
jgi:hypothetical protein